MQPGQYLAANWVTRPTPSLNGHFYTSVFGDEPKWHIRNFHRLGTRSFVKFLPWWWHILTHRMWYSSAIWPQYLFCVSMRNTEVRCNIRNNTKTAGKDTPLLFREVQYGFDQNTLRWHYRIKIYTYIRILARLFFQAQIVYYSLRFRILLGRLRVMFFHIDATPISWSHI